MSLGTSKEALQRRIAKLEARARVKPLGAMAQADLDHARAALAAYGTEKRVFNAKGKSKVRKKRPGPRQVRVVVSGGLPGLGRRSR